MYHTLELLRLLKTDTRHGVSCRLDGTEILNSNTASLANRADIIFYQLAIQMEDCQHRKPSENQTPGYMMMTSTVQAREIGTDYRYDSMLASSARPFYTPDLLNITMEALLFRLNSAVLKEYQEQEENENENDDEDEEVLLPTIQNVPIQLFRTMEDLMLLSQIVQEKTDKLLQAAEQNNTNAMTYYKHRGASVYGIREELVKTIGTYGSVDVLLWLEAYGFTFTLAEYKTIRNLAIFHGCIPMLQFLYERHRANVPFVGFLFNTLTEWFDMLTNAGQSNQLETLRFLLTILETEGKLDTVKEHELVTRVQKMFDKWISNDCDDAVLMVMEMWTPIVDYFWPSGILTSIGNSFNRQIEENLLNTCIVKQNLFMFTRLLEWCEQANDSLGILKLTRTLGDIFGIVGDSPLSDAQLLMIDVLVQKGADRNIVRDPLTWLQIEKVKVNMVYQTIKNETSNRTNSIIRTENARQNQQQQPPKLAYEHPLNVVSFVNRGTQVLISNMERQRELEKQERLEKEQKERERFEAMLARVEEGMDEQQEDEEDEDEDEEEDERVYDHLLNVHRQDLAQGTFEQQQQAQALLDQRRARGELDAPPPQINDDDDDEQEL